MFSTNYYGYGSETINHKFIILYLEATYRGFCLYVYVYDLCSAEVQRDGPPEFDLHSFSKK